ncbi:MAG: hypothetical protein Q9169_003226 [Polycauliona sp. 2 TL-2023]
MTLATQPEIANQLSIIKSLRHNSRFAPSSSSTYKPPTERAQQIETLINTHPLVQRLRSDPQWHESRPHVSMPPAMAQHSLTASTLSGDTKIPVPPIIFTKGTSGSELIAISYLGADLCGHVGIIHGGMMATMLDEGLARCCFAALPNKIGVTARLEIDYRKPVRCEGLVVLKARTEKVEGRKAWVKGRVESLDMNEKGGGVVGRGDGAVEVSAPYEERGEVLVEAEGLFVEPKWAKVRSQDRIQGLVGRDVELTECLWCEQNLPAFARPT